MPSLLDDQPPPAHPLWTVEVPRPSLAGRDDRPARSVVVQRLLVASAAGACDRKGEGMTAGGSEEKFCPPAAPQAVWWPVKRYAAAVGRWFGSLTR